ncbi:hypothetical protein [Metabacillus niabensis]|uniref:hypothetical protein n=1 Tax=Metabacillus niabensis TaxID=324854 RepID=UPI001CFBB069|nr:hypothetical protein [Metabacillus niabensis]
MLTITNCKIISNNQINSNVRERIEVDFIDEENKPLKKIFYRDTGMVNFAKFIEDIFIDPTWDDLDLNHLVGNKIKAYIYHNYLANGKGYANIAKCELYQ